MDSEQIILILLKFGPTIFMYHSRTFRRQVSFCCSQLLVSVKNELLVRKNLLPFLTQPGPTFWPQKTQIRNSLNNILVKKDRNYINYYQICDFKTDKIKVKLLRIISFLPFWTQIGQKVDPNILQVQHFQLYLPYIFTQVFIQPLLFAVKGICYKNYEKNLSIMQFLYFFHNFQTQFGPPFAPKSTPTLMLGHQI